MIMQYNFASKYVLFDLQNFTTGDSFFLATVCKTHD